MTVCLTGTWAEAWRRGESSVRMGGVCGGFPILLGQEILSKGSQEGEGAPC